MSTITYEYNPLTGAVEPKRSAEEEAMRYVKRGMAFDVALLLVKGEKQR